MAPNAPPGKEFASHTQALLPLRYSLSASGLSVTFGRWFLPLSLWLLLLKQHLAGVLPYRTSSMTASPPVISTVSPGRCVRTARASGDT